MESICDFPNTGRAQTDGATGANGLQAVGRHYPTYGFDGEIWVKGVS